MAEAVKSDSSTADVSSPPQKKVRKGDDHNESLGGHPTVRDHPVSSEKGRVHLSDDRVTFTVQNEIAVESKRTAPFPYYESQPSASDGAEDLWLSAFNRYLKQHSSQCCTDSGCRTDPMEVQAFYHSSVFPNPTMRMQMGDVSNGLVCACLSAFTEHKRLILRPDDIFLPLLDAAATFVFQNGEASRNVFVDHEGQKKLVVNRDNFEAPGCAANVNDWAGTLPEFRAQLHRNVRSGSVDAALPTFSTSDSITAAAFTSTLMRALQNFFTYEYCTMCGIPEVTLLGTIADWTDLHARFLVLAETWMQRTAESDDWVKAVDNFLKQFIAARSGQVDVAWWVSLFTYKGSKGSGSSPHVTGHINALFPWAIPTSSHAFAGGKGATQEKKDMVWVGVEKYKKSFPGGMNWVPMQWSHYGKPWPMKAWAGSMCASVSADGSEVAPAVCVGFTIDAQPNPEKP